MCCFLRETEQETEGRQNRFAKLINYPHTSISLELLFSNMFITVDNR